jgi:hypothetical protein
MAPPSSRKQISASPPPPAGSPAGFPLRVLAPQRFRGWLYDKQTHVEALVEKHGFKLVVLSDLWVVHRPHKRVALAQIHRRGKLELSLHPDVGALMKVSQVRGSGAVHCTAHAAGLKVKPSRRVRIEACPPRGEEMPLAFAASRPPCVLSSRSRLFGTEQLAVPAVPPTRQGRAPDQSTWPSSSEYRPGPTPNSPGSAAAVQPCISMFLIPSAPPY